MGWSASKNACNGLESNSYMVSFIFFLENIKRFFYILKLDLENIMKLIRLKYFSDIHLEYNNKKLNVANLLSKKDPVEYLALLGDIGHPKTDIYKNFIKDASLSFNKVFLVAGNHEYYGSSIEEINYELEKLESIFKNVYFMNRKKVSVNNNVILGCTLWSKLENSSHDFSQIKILAQPPLEGEIDSWNSPEPKFKNFDKKKYLDMHNKDVEWLTKHLDYSLENPIILTHHLPTFKLISKRYENYRNKSGFATNLEHLFQPGMQWLCGHSHDCINVNINNTNLHINSGSFINPEKYIEI